AVRLDVENELVQVGTLLHARALDRVGNATNRRERRVELQAPDGPTRLFESRALYRRTVATAAFDFERHVELARLREIRDDELGVQHFDVVVELNVAGRHGTRALLMETQLRLIACIEANRHLLEIQQDVDDIFLYALDARVLVQYAVDLRLGDCAPRHGRQQHAPERVAQGMTEPPLERLDHDLRLTWVGGRDFDDARLQELANGCLHGPFTCLDRKSVV